jgi:hypothetical protein
VETDGLDGATVELGANLSFIFYPATDDAGNLIYDIDSYVLTANGRVLESEILTDGNGKIYIKATTYAYGITGTVNYTFEGGNGYYSLKAYYVYASGEGEGSDALISIVERLYKYSESAKKYRDNALQNN